MGQVIRKDASVEDILADATKTLTNATARGGDWKSLAEQRLGPALVLFADNHAQYKAADAAHAPNAATIAMRNVQADRTIGKVYDTLWNEVGRPGSDAALSVIFPEGAGYYTDGDSAEQPDRMAILVTLLGAGIHPKLLKATADACAMEIASDAALLEAAVTAGRKTGAHVKVLSRVRTALSRVVQSELSHLKRLYKAAGLREADIHAVIPVRPVKAKKAEAA